MKISTRLALGLSLLVGLVVAATAYQLAVMQKLQDTSAELAGVRLEASRVALGVIQGTDNVLEFSAKALLLGDADYTAEWARAEARLAGEIEALEGLSLGGDAEEEARARILDSRAAWTETMGSLLPALPGEEAPVRPAAPDRATGGTLPETPPPPLGMAQALEAVDTGEPHLLALRGAAADLLRANEIRVSDESAAAVAAGDRARRVGWVAAGVSALGAVFLGWILFLAISKPLRRLTHGTRELARGRFDHRIDDRSGSELGALARDFNVMAERLGELEELKQDFVSHVSHELKGPLAAVQETILVLLEELPGPVNERQRHLLQLSEASAARLSRMISNLLEASRLEAGAARFDPAPLELGAVVRDVLEEISPLADEGKLVLSLAGRGGEGAPLPALLVGDGERLREVVANLVGNAVKFSPDGGRVRSTLEITADLPRELPHRYRELGGREPGPFVRLAVEDEGPGVPPEHREGVFEKFYQVRLEGRAAGQGVGLGLAISRRIVEGHGGAIWVDESPLGGARFTVILPVGPSRWAEFEAGDGGGGEGGGGAAAGAAEGDPASPPADPSDADGRTMAHA